MRSARFLFGVRLAAVLALAVSAALWVDYTQAVPSFCGAESGCAAVRQSGYGYLVLSNLVLPVPIFGLVGFAVLLGVALIPALRKWIPLVAGLGGLSGLGLFGVQLFKIGHLCTLCAAVDSLAVLAAVFAFFLWRNRKEPSPDWGLRWGAWPVLGAVLLLAPVLWPQLRPAAAVPAEVRRLYRPGKINVVEFADYECPYCRALHPQLTAVIDSYPGKVNFTRLNLPLKSHPFAHGAALAQVCAREQGKGHEMADRLFQAENLRPEANRAVAQELGVELGAYDRCLASSNTERTIEAESKILIDSGLQGLPTTYVGAKTIVGAQPEEVFRDAFDHAERGDAEDGVSASTYWLCVLLLLGAVSWVGRVRRATL